MEVLFRIIGSLLTVALAGSAAVSMIPETKTGFDRLSAANMQMGISGKCSARIL